MEGETLINYEQVSSRTATLRNVEIITIILYNIGRKR